ncbi:MAG: ABC transporter ATP-binding protein [bacterium]|nr:ABC transporter ATP-binding protein [bacterium]
MPKPRTIEKSKDFKGSMKRLINALDKWKKIMIIALVLGFSSAIISLITPDKISQLTDTITDSLSVDSEVMNELVTKINSNSTGSDLVIKGTTITYREQLEFITLISQIDKENTNDIIKMVDTLPESIKSIVIKKMDFDSVKHYSLIIGILFLISAFFGYIQSYMLTTVSNNFARNLRDKISKKINILPLKYFDSHETGDVLSRVTNDVDTISSQMNNSLATLISSITLFIGSIIMMFKTNSIMAITAILSSLIGFIFMFIIINKSQKYFVQRQTELGNMNGFIEEMYSSHIIVKSYNGLRDANEKFNELNKKLYTCNRKGAFLSGLMQPFMGFIGNFGYLCVCVVGVLLTMNNKITFGVIIAFMIYVRQFTNPLSQIAQAMTNLQSTAAASERIFEFLDEKEMSNENNCTSHLDKSKVKGNIEFKNVKFGYNKNHNIINNFCAKANPGDKIAIVGPTGAGKTTMVNLLMKFYEINEGDILIDGVSIKNMTRKNIHDLFVMVLQDTWLFDGSIKENLIFNKGQVSEEEINDTLKVVGIDHFVNTLPGGINANVNDNDTISSGQKQLLTIARGMIKDAPFLILDEATSNVDTRTEELVSSAMDKLTLGRTSFIIAHRLSTIKNANLILVMNEGNIIEQGTHEELMNKNGFYADLYNSQFKL